ncbi:MAG: hypothetical protein AAFS06_22630 [Cyanobacteria bacterium J06631_12]
MDASLPADFLPTDLKLSTVSPTDFEDWFMLVLELWLEEETLIENTGSYQFHTKVGFEEVERVVCFIKPFGTEILETNG